MKVIVCGGRDFQDWKSVCEVLNALNPKPTLIVEGGAKGADAMAHAWANLHRVKCVQFTANWDAHGRAAGPIRNRKMLTETQPDIVVAFPGGRGTADMMKQAKLAGVRVMEVSKLAAAEKEQL